MRIPVIGVVSYCQFALAPHERVHLVERWEFFLSIRFVRRLIFMILAVFLPDAALHYFINMNSLLWFTNWRNTLLFFMHICYVSGAILFDT